MILPLLAFPTLSHSPHIYSLSLSLSLSFQGQLSDLEGEVVKLRSHLRLKEEEVAEINEIATRLTRERDQFADVVRQEFADRQDTKTLPYLISHSPPSLSLSPPLSLSLCSQANISRGGEQTNEIRGE